MHSIPSRFQFKRFALPAVMAVGVVLTIGAAATTPARPKILVDLGHGQAGFVDAAGKESPRLLGYRAIAEQQAADLATTKEPPLPRPSRGWMCSRCCCRRRHSTTRRSRRSPRSCMTVAPCS